MQFELTPYTIPLLVAGAGAVVLAVLAWLRRDEPGGRALTVYLVAVGVGAFGYGMSISTVAIETKYLWTRLSLLAMAVTAASWLYFALRYCARTRWVNRWTRVGLAAEPVALAVVLVAPELQSLVYDLPDSGGVGTLSGIGATPGPVFVVHFTYIVVTMAGATLLFVDLFVRSRTLYRAQATAILVAALAPWGAVVVRTLGFTGEYDVTLFGWVLSGAAMCLALYRFRVLDPVPTARKSIVENMGDGVLVVDEDDRIGDANQKARQLLGDGGSGDGRSDLVGVPVDTVVPDWASIVAGDPTEWHERSVEGRAVEGDDGLRHLELQSKPFFDHHDRRVGRVVVIRDVTVRTRREQQLARYKTVFESVQDRVFVLDESGRFTKVNGPFASLLGCEPADLIGEPFATVVDDEDAERVLAARVDDGASDTVEVSVVARDGTRIPCEASFAPVSFEGDERGSVGVVRDISRRRAVEQNLQATTERLETLVEASPLAIVAVDTDGTVEVWNPAAEELFGWSAAEVTGDQLTIIPEEYQEKLDGYYERVLRGETIRDLEIPLEHRDGFRIETSVSVAPVTDGDGDVTGIVGVIADVTERKERERQLRRQNERLDEFARVVSHDLRNPLTVASGHLELVRETGDETHLEDVESAHGRMSDIIDDVLTLAREGRDADEFEPVVLSGLVRQSWETAATGDAELHVVDDLPTVQGDPSRLTELFENLFRNAVEHGGCDVTVTVGTLDDGQGFYVADDGPGIPPEDREQVFDSGFTTAEDGTGFGLAIVATVTDAHGWAVDVTESEDHGARFEFVVGD